MPISFANIPSNIKVPLYWVEVDPSMAGLPSINLRCLLIGTAVGGTAPYDIAVPIGSQAQADAQFGEGSELARMFLAYYANNFANEVWGLPVQETSGAAPSTGTITVTTPPTQAGTIHLYIAGDAVPVNVLTTDSISTIAANIADAINAATQLPVTAVAAAGVVTLTSTFNSVNANEITVIMNYYGSIGGEQTPIGLGITLPQAAAISGGGTGTSTGTNHLTVGGTVTGTIVNGAAVTGTGVPAGTVVVSQFSGTPGGAGVYVTNQVTTLASVALTFTGPLPPAGMLYGGTGTPNFTNAIANLGDEPYEYAVMPYTDSNSMFEWDQEYGFTDQGRWGWLRELFGHVITAKRGTYANLLAYGDTLNSGVESVMGFEVASPSASYEWAAAYGAKTQRAFINDPARPLQSLSLNNIKAASIHQRFDFEELNSLALNGIAIQKIGGDGQPMIAREQTTYQMNQYGQSDDAYELMTTLATLAKLLRNQKAAITTKFPRHKLADDGTKFGPGQAIVTPGIIKAELINEYQQDMYNGLVENLSDFKKFLLVERDPNDPNRVNVLYPPDLINQLRIFAVLAQFRLQYDRGIDSAIIGPAPAPFQATSGA
jgi:phage tail sheath gpL-like